MFEALLLGLPQPAGLWRILRGGPVMLAHCWGTKSAQAEALREQGKHGEVNRLWAPEAAAIVTAFTGTTLARAKKSSSGSATVVEGASCKPAMQFNEPDAVRDLDHGFDQLSRENLQAPNVARQADAENTKFGVLRSPNELMGVEPASEDLLTSIGRKRDLIIAKPGSEELRMLDYFGAEASVGGANNSSILLRENPSKAAALEEFLHGTQAKLGVVDRFGTSGFGSAEMHVKDFMIRHQKMLRLSDEDIRILQTLRDNGL